MNEAIKLAIEKGGWQPYELKKKATELMMVKNKGDYFRHQLDQDNSTASEAIELLNLWNKYVEDVAVLDPLFWQALGRALGWEEYNAPEVAFNRELTWKFKAHQYFDLVLTGGSTEKFWKELIN